MTTATDFRNLAWSDIQDRLTGLRLAVYHAWLEHGPSTTRQVAERSKIDLLTLRPRTTELMHLGLIECREEDQIPGHEGFYHAVSLEQAERALAAYHAQAETQRQLI